jgi:hypothetical protein
LEDSRTGIRQYLCEQLTDEQLDAILVFYKSPTGIALVEKLPTLTAQGMQLAQSKIILLQPQMKQMIEDFAKKQNSTRVPSAPNLLRQ